MQLDHIELTRLVVSPANMRAKRKDRDIAELIPSVRARGVLVPLLVRPNGEPDTFEIVAGRRRYFAAKTLAEGEGGPSSVPCAIMALGDDAAALEASLIENLDRSNPDEVSEWETFARLVKEGRSVEDIAATFGLEERAVNRVLALGNLLPRIRSLYRTEQINVATVRHLTMATKAQQRAWLALFNSTDQYAPTGRVLKEWLFGGAAIPTTSALFELSSYTAPIVGDLFADECYFSDASLFWTLQFEAIEQKRQAFLAEGWADAAVIAPGTYFARWEYEKRSQADGGKVYIVAHESGEVEVHEGLLSHKEARQGIRNEDPKPKAARPELSAPLRRYIDLHRHALVRAELLDHPWVALRLMLAHAIAGSPLWNVRAEHQRADKPETEQSVRHSGAQLRFDTARQEALPKLGYEPEAGGLVDACRTPLPSVFEELMALSDQEVLGLVPLVMGETLEAGGPIIGPLGTLLAVEPSGAWQADDAFLMLMRDRAVLLALVTEIAGSQVASANAKEPGRSLKNLVRDCLEGENRRAKVEGWTPRWMRFPASTYLEAADPESQSS